MQRPLARVACIAALTQLPACLGYDAPLTTATEATTSSTGPETTTCASGQCTTMSSMSMSSTESDSGMSASESATSSSSSGAPLTCGDGTTDAGEECDDGNADNTDSCLNNCTRATCGDGFVLANAEQCDDGNSVDTDDCPSTCKAATCGDGFVQDGAEQCDNGPANSDAAYGDTSCNTQCTPGLRCGDGLVQDTQGEKCDDGTPDNDDLCVACLEIPRRHVFVTSATYTGKFGSAKAADGLCLTTAGMNDVGVPGAEWTAWLSDNVSSVSGRYTNKTFDGWYVLPTDPPTLVAKGWAGLTSGTLSHAIDMTEMGTPLAPVPPDALVSTAWTNTMVDGSVPDNMSLHCKSWNNNTMGETGRLGDTNATDSNWTDNGMTAACNAKHHIYCVEN